MSSGPYLAGVGGGVGTYGMVWGVCLFFFVGWWGVGGVVGWLASVDPHFLGPGRIMGNQVLSGGFFYNQVFFK